MRRRFLSRLSLLVLLSGITAGSLASTGCITVQAWERGRLADPQMKFDDNASLAAYQAHWQEAREGSSGGSGVQGGGCGCK
jgi:Domain of unknown function (DUF4266)